MVGHTGVIKAAEQACRTVDSCVERVVDAVLKQGGNVLLTADHGNAEEMIGPDGGPQTSHSTNPVPLVFISRQSADMRLDSGILGDIAPTILGILNIDRPTEMTGKNLLQGKG
jgi:2,3-bisphosphoglycerate-independent phosphoglycerate mutase